MPACHLLPQVQEALAELAAVESVDGSQDLFRAHVGALLERLAASHRDWGGRSTGFLQFDVVLVHSGEPQTGAPGGVRSAGPWWPQQPRHRRAQLLSTTQEAARQGPVLQSHSRSLSACGEQLF